MSQSQQQTQTTDIHEEDFRTSKNLLCVEDANEKLWHMLKSHKIRSPFYTKSSLSKLFCKPKDQVATEDKNNIIYGIDRSNCEAVYFDESKRSLKLCSDERKRCVKNCNCKKNEIAKHCWEVGDNFSWNQLLIEKRGQFLGGSKTPYIL